MNKINKIEIEDLLKQELNFSKTINVTSNNKKENKRTSKLSKKSFIEKIFNQYKSNDLIKYAFLSFMMLMFSTVLLSLAELSSVVY